MPTLSWLCFPLPRTISAARTIASPFATCASFCSWPQPIIGGGAHSSTLHGRRCERKCASVVAMRAMLRRRLPITCRQGCMSSSGLFTVSAGPDGCMR